MEIEVQLTSEPIADKIPPPASGAAGAWVEFRGIVRGEENGGMIAALEYEAYAPMAKRELHRLLVMLGEKFPCHTARVIHRVGRVPVGEAAVYVGVAARHRGPACALLVEFMDRLKQDVPIWKRGARPEPSPGLAPAQVSKATGGKPGIGSATEARAEIRAHCLPLPGVAVPLAEAVSRVLRATVCAAEDFPARDASTRDGFAVLLNDPATTFTVVDTLQAADWKPRQLQAGEAVRVATGTSLPGENLRVVMQEDVARTGDKITLRQPDPAANVRRRGEEIRAGAPVLAAGTKLDAGGLALLAAVGCARPLVSPRLRVVHFTTGDEIVPPEQTPQPGQVHDSNSVLLRALLERAGCAMVQAHLPEDFARAKLAIENGNWALADANLVLVSGGASVGDKDFTRPLLQWLGFEVVFSQLNIRPGKPLIFGTSGARVAFGLPGNPLAHLVCYHLFVAAALDGLMGSAPNELALGTLTAPLTDEPNRRETFWPARLKVTQGRCMLTPLRWNSSGDVTALTADALVCVPVQCGLLPAGAEVQFWRCK